jgi:hypothetical protein
VTAAAAVEEMVLLEQERLAAGLGGCIGHGGADDASAYDGNVVQW